MLQILSGRVLLAMHLKVLSRRLVMIVSALVSMAQIITDLTRVLSSSSSLYSIIMSYSISSSVPVLL